MNNEIIPKLDLSVWARNNPCSGLSTRWKTAWYPGVFGRCPCHPLWKYMDGRRLQDDNIMRVTSSYPSLKWHCYQHHWNCVKTTCCVCMNDGWRLSFSGVRLVLWMQYQELISLLWSGMTMNSFPSSSEIKTLFHEYLSSFWCICCKTQAVTYALVVHIVSWLL